MGVRTVVPPCTIHTVFSGDLPSDLHLPALWHNSHSGHYRCHAISVTSTFLSCICPWLRTLILWLDMTINYRYQLWRVLLDQHWSSGPCCASPCFRSFTLVLTYCHLIAHLFMYSGPLPWPFCLLVPCLYSSCRCLLYSFWCQCSLFFATIILLINWTGAR